MANGSLEARLSYIEQIIIIIIVGGGFPGFPPKGDPLATDTSRLEALARFGGGLPRPGPGVDPAVTDTTRLEALSRIFGRGPIGDPFSPDLSRLSAIEIESGVHQVNAELVRLKALSAQMQDRLKEMTGKSESS